MKRFIFLAAAILFSKNLASSQEMDKVPKVYSLEAGYRYVLTNDFVNQASHGYTAIFDYAWQLSGFNKKKASYITVPLGFSMLPADSPEDKDVSILSYGWTVRHEMARNRPVIPFVGYALLLNQYSEKGIVGKIFGHQTRFAAGADFHRSGSLIPFIKLEYSLTRYPVWGDADSKSYHFAGVKLGLRYATKH